MGLVDDILSAVVAIFVIVIGIILMQALYPFSPLAAVLGIFCLVAAAVYIIIKLFSDLSG
jgi:hypothetical protein